MIVLGVCCLWLGVWLLVVGTLCFSVVVSRSLFSVRCSLFVAFCLLAVCCCSVLFVV